jgi:hypothetical protein
MIIEIYSTKNYSVCSLFFVAIEFLNYVRSLVLSLFKILIQIYKIINCV